MVVVAPTQPSKEERSLVPAVGLAMPLQQVAPTEEEGMLIFPLESIVLLFCLYLVLGLDCVLDLSCDLFEEKDSAKWGSFREVLSDLCLSLYPANKKLDVISIMGRFHFSPHSLSKSDYPRVSERKSGV